MKGKRYVVTVEKETLYHPTPYYCGGGERESLRY